jgi:hypothetical protein
MRTIAVVKRLAAPLALLLAASVALACATRESAERAPESQTALALPEQDPVDHGTPRERLLVTGTEQVTLAAVADTDAAPKVVRFLAPDLTVAQADDVRRAYPETPWAPPPAGARFGSRIATVRTHVNAPPQR